MNIEINETHLCCLIKEKNRINIKYLKIEQFFTTELDKFHALCYNEKTALNNIILFLQNLKLIGIESNSKYCKDLDRAYQGVSFIINNVIMIIIMYGLPYCPEP